MAPMLFFLLINPDLLPLGKLDFKNIILLYMKMVLYENFQYGFPEFW